MKMDIEGSDYEIVAALLAQGSLCKINTITIEWHSQFCKGPLCNVNLPELAKLLPSIGCNVNFVNKDDETYLHDLQPLRN